MAGCNPDIAFDAFIFDLDGTLLDTADDLGGALNRVLADANIAPVDKSIYRPAASNGANALLEVGFGDKWPDVEQLALRQQLLDYYAEDIAIHSKCFNGIEQLLASLEQNSIKWGIMTNKPGFLTEPLVQAIPSLANAMAVVSGDTLAVAKPSPEPLIHTANMLDVDPTRCLYIGDAERDIQAAKAANMYSATALWGYIPSVDTALSWGADFNWQTPTDGFIHI
ncbi:haloacid dehalogenase [Pseudoalteromonas lipolytica SCSIO 04301]|jgi:phosphoglycolate phosphatase|uniref:HAD family hydrolase n=1 Tax=Pseudoalteromonas TaxID=53246 RepID=UPI0004469848|nr:MULTISPECIES: HAD-IA family hydrolase [Pseudoalteromonas]EWH07207.1 haloacid dehalogenase [Pseudoalteromonas lipolytica SCSIO 04301]MCC9659826.1 HAD-IA family hydrolase [Pseudoalteromonas sp. MB41]QLJ09665.1 HAD-IA family hydrolase [Pseudoalteromonas sp. JSTW]QMW15871.1 HAD-IA family hydrolase [Pseudoalteromonas sp. MT33b]QPL44256.1 HAD-IA family hydrolase [Pseudoalteromonas sp. A41-2]